MVDYSDSSRSSSIVTEGDLPGGESESSSEDADVSGDESESYYDSDSSSLGDDSLESELESDTNSSSTASSDETWSSSVSSDSDLDMPVTNSEPSDEGGIASLSEFHTPLYEGAELSVLDSHLLLYQYALRHCLTKQAFMELISLVDTHVPKDSKAASSLYKLRKFFEEHFNDTKCHIYEYCAKCHRLLDSEVTGGAGCSSGCGGSTVNQFIFISVEAQLKKKLEGKYTVATWLHAVWLFLVMRALIFFSIIFLCRTCPQSLNYAIKNKICSFM